MAHGYRRVAAAGVLSAALLTAAACGAGSTSDGTPQTPWADPAATAQGGVADDASDDGSSTGGTASDDDGTSDDGTSDDGATFDLAAFCAAAAPTQQAVAREFIGSDEHVAQLDALLEVAPDALVEQIRVVRDHFDTDVHPSDPASQDFENFPPAVQATATEVQDGIAEYC